MHVSNLIDIDYMVAPGLHVGVTSTDALNGYKSYGMITRAIGYTGDVMQVQYCPDGSEFHRIRTGAAWSEWSADVMTYEYPGKMVFDHDLGKPLWISEVKPYDVSIRRLTLSTPLVIGAFSITCGPATSDNANCSFVIGSQSASFSVASTDTGADIATKLAAMSPLGYIGTVEGSTATFTREGDPRGELGPSTQISIFDDVSGATYVVSPPDIVPQTLAGDITVQMTQESDPVTLTVGKAQDAYFIAEELAALFADNTEWDALYSQLKKGSILFAAKTAGVKSAMSVDTGETLVYRSIEEEVVGSASVFVDATGQTVYE